MGILAWIVVGLVAGWLASQVMCGGGYGILGVIVMGMVGAVIGNSLASTSLHIPNAVNGFNLASVTMALAGAVILITRLHRVPGSSCLTT